MSRQKHPRGNYYYQEMNLYNSISTSIIRLLLTSMLRVRYACSTAFPCRLVFLSSSHIMFHPSTIRDSYAAYFTSSTSTGFFEYRQCMTPGF